MRRMKAQARRPTSAAQRKTVQRGQSPWQPGPCTSQEPANHQTQLRHRGGAYTCRCTTRNTAGGQGGSLDPDGLPAVQVGVVGVVVDGHLPARLHSAKRRHTRSSLNTPGALNGQKSQQQALLASCKPQQEEAAGAAIPAQILLETAWSAHILHRTLPSARRGHPRLSPRAPLAA